MATTNYAIFIDEATGNYAPVVHRTPATPPAGGTRVAIPDESDNANSGITNVVVSGATNATPIVLTVPSGHGIANGTPVTVSGVGGNTAANGTFVLSASGGTTITLGNSAGNGAYTSGGVVSARTRTAVLPVALAKAVAAVLNDLSSQN
jgi:hypothetical protein